MLKFSLIISAHLLCFLLFDPLFLFGYMFFLLPIIFYKQILFYLFFQLCFLIDCLGDFLPHKFTGILGELILLCNRAMFYVFLPLTAIILAYFFWWHRPEVTLQSLLDTHHTIYYDKDLLQTQLAYISNKYNLPIIIEKYYVGPQFTTYVLKPSCSVTRFLSLDVFLAELQIIPHVFNGNLLLLAPKIKSNKLFLGQVINQDVSYGFLIYNMFQRPSHIDLRQNIYMDTIEPSLIFSLIITRNNSTKILYTNSTTLKEKYGNLIELISTKDLLQLIYDRYKNNQIYTPCWFLTLANITPEYEQLMKYGPRVSIYLITTSIHPLCGIQIAKKNSIYLYKRNDYEEYITIPTMCNEEIDRLLQEIERLL